MAEKALSRGEIFVVDDDPAVRDTLSMVLSAGGYQVICFPVKIKGASAGWSRVVALFDD